MIAANGYSAYSAALVGLAVDSHTERCVAVAVAVVAAAVAVAPVVVVAVVVEGCAWNVFGRSVS